MNNHDEIFNDNDAASLNEGGGSMLPPDGYFEAFSKKMMARIEAEEELKDFSALAAISKRSPFTVPGGYFENAADYSEELTAYPQLGNIARPSYVPVDAAYFEAMQQQVLYKAELAEELKPYPSLYAIDKRQPALAVPADYFEDLAGHVKDRIHSRAETPVVGLLTRIAAFVLRPKTALSFGLALILVVGLLVYNRPGAAVQPVSGDCKTLACLEKGDVLNDHTMHSLDDESLMDIVDVNTLSHQISADAAPDATQKEQYLIDNANTDQLMEEL